MKEYKRIVESFEGYIDNLNQESDLSLGSVNSTEIEDFELVQLKRGLELATKRYNDAKDEANRRLALRGVDRANRALDSYYNKLNKTKYRVNNIIRILKRNGVEKGENYRMGSSRGYYMNDKYSPTIISLKGIKSDIFKKVVDDLISDGFKIKSLVEPDDNLNLYKLRGQIHLDF